jgi:small subunit ribosomal protein S21
MAPINIRVEGSIDKALRQFKKKCIDAGIYNELKRVAFYEKPSETRRKQEIKRQKVVRSSTRKKSLIELLKKPLKPKRFSRRPF